MQYDMKEHIHQSNLIESIDSNLADEQYLEAWEYLSSQKELTHLVICETHRLITRHQEDLAAYEKGQYRRGNVYIGGKLAPSWTMVESLMNNWLLDYKKMQPIQAHVRFESIHPFIDGNGRTGRALLWWHEVSKGIRPSLFENKDKYLNYYTLFS